MQGIVRFDHELVLGGPKGPKVTLAKYRKGQILNLTIVPANTMPRMYRIEGLRGYVVSQGVIDVFLRLASAV